MVFKPILLPRSSENLHNQTKLSEISQEEFLDGVTPSKCSTKDRILQVIQFVLGLGWLRIFIVIVSSLLYFILLGPVVLLVDYPNIIKHLVDYGFFVTRIYIRIIYAALGLYKFNVTGEIDYEARAMAFNHQSILDGPGLFAILPFTVISMAEMKKVPFFGKVLKGEGAIFVDRSKNAGTAQYVIDQMNDLTKRHLALAPEGKTTKGYFLLKFHTGGFLTDKPVQPVSIQYKTYFAYGQAGHTWLVGGFLEFIWRALCVPCGSMNFHFLPTLKGEEYLKKSPQERALQCQLAIANDLGLLATNRSNKELPQNKIEDDNDKKVKKD